MEQLVNFIIRPPRAEYDPKNDLLEDEFMLKGQWFQRKDLEVTNSRGDVLQCSHYMPLVIPDGITLPCVIYCHGNSGCRADASEAAIILLPSYITVFTLDFSGSGLSGGEHVTLGWNEKDDLQAVVNYLRSDGNVSCIGLWGRSMGAVTSLMYGAEDPSIAGMVLDSPFSDLVDLMMELVDTYKFRLPKFTVKFAIQYMRKVIQKKAKFDITDLNTIKVAKSCFVPVLFGHAVDDDFINPHHTDRIYEAYVGDKNIIKFEGDHNSPRPQFYFDSITIFFHNVLNPPTEAFEKSYFDTMHDYFGKASWDSARKLGQTSHTQMKTSEGMGSSSTEEAINELRSKRQMSRTEVPSDNPSGENQSASELGGEKDLVSSSAGLISFDLSNGHLHEPTAPNTTDDDEYIEYPLDNLSDFPCNMEEEERMLMEAVLQSLKDLDNKHTNEAQSPSVDTKSPESSSSRKDNSKSFQEENSRSSGTDCTTSTSENANDLASSNMKIISAATEQQQHTVPTGPSTTESKSSAALSKLRNAVKSSSLSNAPNTSGSKSPAPPTQDEDISGGTRATITVQKNPSSNIMDGLMHRWGLNFFKNS
ncbi:uncharacterized protein LOC113355365 isoform X1 [Papaver somniferum]|uniref:uncharacterized protein LOC113355365 isoform X1 n=2 Tax=Papaver somniferum TaxID=3469 RepID=UPI000E705FFA|nr:uncharacterized protein LOC113355365 isoform X1 [Papaver somniferum]